MSRATDLLTEVERRGARVMLGGDTGAIVYPCTLVAELVPILRLHRDAIIRELRRRDTQRWRSEFLEMGQRLGWPRVVNDAGAPINRRGKRGWQGLARVGAARVVEGRVSQALADLGPIEPDGPLCDACRAARRR